MSSELVLAAELPWPPSVGDFFLPDIAGPWVTKFTMMIWLAVALLLIFFLVAYRKPQLVPGRTQWAAESVYGLIRDNVAKEQMGTPGIRFAPYLTVLFCFILLTNLFGIVPGLQISPNSHIAFPIVLAAISYVLYLSVGIRKHGFGKYMKMNLIHVDETERFMKELAEADVAAMVATEARVLADGLRAETDDDAVEAAREFLRLRGERRAPMTNEAIALERAVEWTEGLARYADIALTEAAAEGYDPTDRDAVYAFLRERQTAGELPTGLLYLAILTDTGSFHHSNITPRTFEICRQVTEAGVNPASMARRVFDSNSFGKLKLIGALLNAMELADEGRLGAGGLGLGPRGQLPANCRLRAGIHAVR